jgi:O-antigen ligase
VRVHRLHLPLALFRLLIIVQVLFSISAYVYVTRYELWKYLAYANLFVVAQCLRRTGTRRLLTILSTAGFIISLFAIVQDLTYNEKIYWIRPSVFHAFGPYFNSNHYAGLMEMLTPIALAIALTDMRPSRKVFWSIAGIVMASTIFVCGSRGGMIAFVVQMIVLAVLLVGGKNPRLAWVLVAISLLIASLAFWLDTGRLVHQLNTLRDPLNNSDVTSRLTIARDSLRMLRDRPMLGWGLGLFRTIYPRYRSYSTDLVINQAHNDYVQVLVETGILGFCCVVWFIINLYGSSIANLRSRSPDGTLRALGALIGCTGILIHSLSDFNLQIPANAALFYVLCGISAGGNMGGIPRTSGNP